ncbi:MAG: ATP-grasp domain-containing protein [Candidatus Kapaibacterium sp.]
MKIPIVFNTESPNVLQRRGRKVREFYDPEKIEWIRNGLLDLGHESEAIEGDGFLADRLREFFGDALESGWPGLALNLAYGVQGRVRYTHVPGLLDMLGIPYSGSGPLGQALCADKATSKMIWQFYGLPTPDFAVMNSPDDPTPNFKFPMVIKPKTESTSLGIHKVDNENELCESVGEVVSKFKQPVLIERYLPGREVNAAFVGEEPRIMLPIIEVRIDKKAPDIYTKDDKVDQKRKIEHSRADLTDSEVRRIHEISQTAIDVLHCRDWARVDLRADEDGDYQIMEVNSMPHLNPESSLFYACGEYGWELTDLLDKVIESTVKRYEKYGNENK